MANIKKRNGPRVLTRVRHKMASGYKRSTLKMPELNPVMEDKIGRVIIVTHDIRCNGLLLTEGQIAVVTVAQKGWYSISLDPHYPGWPATTAAFITEKDFKFAGKKMQNEMKETVVSVVSDAVEDNLKAMQIIGALYGKKEKSEGRSKKKA